MTTHHRHVRRGVWALLLLLVAVPVGGDESAGSNVPVGDDGSATDALPRLDAEYIKPGKISFTYKYFPVIDEGRIGESHWAAYAAECANEQGKFWEYHDKLYAEQRGANVGAFTRDNLKRYAADLRLDQARFNQCLDSDRYAILVLEHLTEALQFRLPGTPTFLLNGRKTDTPTLDYSEFWKPLEAELKAR